MHPQCFGIINNVNHHASALHGWPWVAGSSNAPIFWKRDNIQFPVEMSFSLGPADLPQAGAWLPETPCLGAVERRSCTARCSTRSAMVQQCITGQHDVMGASAADGLIATLTAGDLGCEQAKDVVLACRVLNEISGHTYLDTVDVQDALWWRNKAEVDHVHQGPYRPSCQQRGLELLLEIHTPSQWRIHHHHQQLSLLSSNDLVRVPGNESDPFFVKRCPGVHCPPTRQSRPQNWRFWCWQHSWQCKRFQITSPSPICQLTARKSASPDYSGLQQWTKWCRVMWLQRIGTLLPISKCL